MFDEFCLLWAALGRSDAPRAYDDLAHRYSEKHRHYHTLSHIAHCLCEFSSVRQMARDAKAVELALWFHDVVYDPRRHDNEEESAALVRGLGLDAALASEVEKLILSTRVHYPLTADEALVVDIDLTIFGQEWDVFVQYDANIRKEYAWVPEGIYRVRRRAALETFLIRPAIYTTDFFRTKYEMKARGNLSQLLMQM